MTAVGAWPLDDNWASLWESIATVMPDEPAIAHGDDVRTWGEFDRRSGQFAAALDERGVGRADKVAQMLFNCPEYLESVHGAFKLRAIPVNVNYRYRAAEIVHVLSDCDATVLVYHAAFADVVDEARASLAHVKLFVQVADESATALLPGAVDYEQLLASGEPLAPIERSGDDELLVYTGGTTGMPKGVIWKHGGMFRSHYGFEAVGRDMPTSAADVAEVAVELRRLGLSPANITAPPLMHATGLFVAMTAMMMGGTAILLASRRFDATELLKLIERHRATQLTIVGDAFARPIVEELERASAAAEPYDLTSVVRVVSTGVTFSAPLKRALVAHARNATLVDAIGSSEGGPFAFAVTAPGDDILETSTFRMADTTILLDPVTGDRVPPGTGETVVLASSARVPAGYYNDPIKTAETFRVIDGVRHTVPGDYALVDSDGTVQLLGRGSVCINTGGEKVYPEEVETASRSHPAVVDCIAVGVPDERYGEAVALVASVAPGAALEPAQLIEHVRQRLAPYKSPRHVVFVDQVFRGPNGKADYSWARTVAEQRVARP